MAILRNTLLLILFSFSRALFAQSAGEEHPIYQLEARLMKGDQSALFEIAPYFDSKKKVIEALGEHNMRSVESSIAKRVVSENCIFTQTELELNESTTATQFSNFLNANKGRIVFSDLANAFLITPLDQRSVNFEIRTISERKRAELKESVLNVFNSGWVKQQKIDSLIAQRNPDCLLLTASELFKCRNRFSRYYYHKKEFISLLQYLTGTEIGVENELHEISWHIGDDYNPASKLNLLVYFSRNYARYSWDAKKSIFIDPDQEIKPLGQEDELFQLLESKNDAEAMAAFKQLSVSNPAKVIQIAAEYRKRNLSFNRSIPTFPCSFLTQLVLLTDYCRERDIDLSGTTSLQNDIEALQTNLTFRDRRKLEDKLTNTLSLDDITDFEYRVLVYERSWDLVYSAGRIIDIFYSKNWNKLLSDPKHLDCYLKKSILFKNLGIIGTCNNYLFKFSNTTPLTLERLKNHPSSGGDVKSQIEKILLLSNAKPAKKLKPSIWEGNKRYAVKHLDKSLKKLLTQVQDSSETEAAIIKLLSRISYAQIPVAMAAIENFPFESIRQKYSFLVTDWGFYPAGDFKQKETREEFLKLYSQLSESQLYSHYLDRAGIDYKTLKNDLDYDKVYELLKYDNVVAFVGGGGGAEDNEVYMLVKLLELRFKTTLGFPDKLCNSQDMYYCDAFERAQSWMQYLSAKGLLKEKHEEPRAFRNE